MGLYDNYRLANSRLNRQYTGSSLDELTKVSDVMQNRYDATQQTMEGLDQFIKNAKALPQDQQLLDTRSKVYQDKLKEYSQRPDLENIVTDVSKSARRFANEYQNFAGNMKNYYDYKGALDKAVDEGHISRTTANRRLNQSMANYKGLQYNPEEDKYQGQFSGAGWAKEVDIPAWVKKVAGDIAASSHGELWENPDKSGEYFIKTGNKYKAITPAQIQSAIANGLATDPEIQAHIQQQGELAASEGARNLKPEDFGDVAHQKILEQAAKQGVDPQQLIGQSEGRKAMKNLEQSIYNLGMKYAFTDTERSQTMGDRTIEGSQRAAKQGTADMISLATVTPGPGTEVSSGGQYQKMIDDAKATHTQTMQDYHDFLHQPGVSKDSNGRVYKLENGKHVDITAQADAFRDKIAAAQTDQEKLNVIKAAAEQESGYDKVKKDPALMKKAQDAYDRTYEQTGYKPMQGVRFSQGHTYTEAERKQRAADAYDAVMQDNPTYQDYVKALQKRINPSATSSTIKLIGDENAKKIWSDNITGLVSNLGLEKGALAMTIGSGPDQGKQLSAGDYKDIKGKMDVIGWQNVPDGKGGFETQLKVRAYENAKGKKTSGEDILVNLGSQNTDNALRKSLGNEEYTRFKQEGYVQGLVANQTKSGEVPIFDINGNVLRDKTGNVVTAKVSSEGDNWNIDLPGPNGWSNRQQAKSYDGIVDAIHKAYDIYTKH